MTDLFRSLLQHATTQGSRSTALNPLAWALGIILSAFLVAARIPNAPTWVLLLLGSASALFVLSFVIAYFILLYTDRDALRSERFTLSKMAIEKSVVGDSLKGFTAIGPDEQRALPPAETTQPLGLP
jgi:hypothetical protein